MGFQSYSFYRLHTPFRRKKITLIYGGTAFLDAGAARRGVAYRLVDRYMRHVLGPFWALRDYTFLIGTHNPRLIQLMGATHRLYLPTDNTLTPTLFQFVLNFVRQKRANPHPINEHLVVFPPSTDRVSTEITEQWPQFYRASKETFNKLAYDLKLIEDIDGRRYLAGCFLLVLGRSSRSRLLIVS